MLSVKMKILKLIIKKKNTGITGWVFIGLSISGVDHGC